MKPATPSSFARPYPNPDDDDVIVAGRGSSGKASLHMADGESVLNPLVQHPEQFPRVGVDVAEDGELVAFLRMARLVVQPFS
jgi:hypothetical protein